MSDARRGRVLFCKKCNACQASDRNCNMSPCTSCGGLVFVPPAMAPYRLTEHDRRFLRTIRIESTPAVPPFERSSS